jgi:hypothetical protein
VSYIYNKQLAMPYKSNFIVVLFSVLPMKMKDKELQYVNIHINSGLHSVNQPFIAIWMEISKKIRNMSKTVQSLLPAKFANVLTIF